MLCAVLFLFVFYIFDYLLNAAVQNKTKCVQGFRTYRFAVLYPVDRIRRNALFIYQIIFGHTLFKQRAVKRFVAYHFYHHIYFTILK